MGRRRTKHRDLPPGVHRKGNRLYYGRNDAPLGREDDPATWERWAKLRGTEKPVAPTFADAVREYSLRELHKRAPKTQREYRRQLKFLCDNDFGPMPLDSIKPKHIRQYLDLRPPIAGTRDKAAFSLVFTFAREHGLTDAPNPCSGVRGTKSKRKVYVSDAMLLPVLEQCDADTRDYVETLYRTGADAGVASMWRAANVRDGALHFQRSKTGEPVAIALRGPLEEIVSRRLASRVGNVFLFARADGCPIGLRAFQKRFVAARKRTNETWWLKDLRAKAATDSDDLKAAQTLLGHADEATTAGYRRQRVGERAAPITRELRNDSGIAENANRNK